MKKSMLQALKAVKLGAFCFALVLSTTAISRADNIDWTQLGPDFTHYNSFSGVTIGGAAFTVTEQLGGVFERMTQGNGWNGTIPTHTPLLWTHGNGPIHIHFLTGISSFSTLIQSDYMGQYSASMNAFSAGNILLDTATVSGSSQFLPGTAPDFTVSSTAPITDVVIGLASASYAPGDFAIGSVVPEPSTLALLGLGGLSTVFCTIRRRRQVTAA